MLMLKLRASLFYNNKTLATCKIQLFQNVAGVDNVVGISVSSCDRPQPIHSVTRCASIDNPAGGKQEMLVCQTLSAIPLGMDTDSRTGI